MAISEPFAHVLASGRAQFNARVVEARRRYPGFDSEAFAAFLQSGVDPVIRSVAEAAPERLASVALLAYDLALDLVGQALAGPKARSPDVNRVWQEVIPVYAGLAAAHPAQVVGSLTNAVVHIGKVAGARAGQWLDEVTRLAPQIESPAQLQAVGQVLAWRSGLAHFRDGAREAADRLPEPLALAAMGCAGDAGWAQVREKLAKDPWWSPSHQDRVEPAGREFGAYTGLGGEFAEPPEVRACAEGFIVRSGKRFSLLVADAFGTVLHGAAQDDFDHAARQDFAQAASLSGNRVRLPRGVIELDLPADRLALSTNRHTAAVTSPYTHTIRLLPLQ